MENETSPQKLTKGQITSQRILEATARCVAKNGIEKTSITAIAKEAGLKRPLIAYHFPKKDRIFYHVAIMLVQILEGETQGFQSLPAKKQYFECLRTYISFFALNSVYFNCFQHFLYLASINNEYKQLNTQFKNKIRDRLLPSLKEIIQEQRPNTALSSTSINHFLDQVYERVVGASIHFHTIDHTFSSREFLTKEMKVFRKELELFLK